MKDCCGGPATAVAAGPARIAVVGNPNTGKSTLFNRLTGARQQIGNYPGVTVERKQGVVCLPGGRTATLVDLPGTYSLAAMSEDEQIVTDVLLGRRDDVGRPDAVLCVVDATNLKRNLFLAMQVMESGLPVVIALNMTDEAEQRGMAIDAALLGRRLGVRVVAVSAAQGRGIDVLKLALADPSGPPAELPMAWPPSVAEGLRGIGGALAASGRPAPELEVRRLLFDVDSPLAAGLPAAVTASVETARAGLEAAGLDPLEAEAALRYRHIAALLEKAVDEDEEAPLAFTAAYRMDRILTHRVAGLLIFGALMYGVFASIYWLAEPLMRAIDGLFEALRGAVAPSLTSTPMLQSLVADGVIAGVGGVVVFLPQILILFFFIAILEDSGYMARAAFLMDKVFSWTGLNGKSFVPMLSSFACAVPAILGTRTIEDPRARLSTILVSPLMSCSARLPVYVLMIGAFIEPRYGKAWAGAALFAMHLVGLVVAIPVAFLVNRFLLRVRSIPFLLEMPPYRWPRARDVAWRLWRNGSEFVVRAGTVIFAFSLGIWALTYFPRPDAVKEGYVTRIAVERKLTPVQAEAWAAGAGAAGLKAAYLEQSWLGRIGKGVQPAFAPAGFDWKITIGVLASFPAREVIVSTLGIIYAVEEDDAAAPALRASLAAAKRADGTPVFTPAVAIAVMVFFALCMQCGSTVSVIAREASWRWAGAAFAYMTLLAWLGAVAAYQLGSRALG